MEADTGVLDGVRGGGGGGGCPTRTLPLFSDVAVSFLLMHLMCSSIHPPADGKKFYFVLANPDHVDTTT